MGDTFPRLTDIAYLEEGLRLMKSRPTFESLRLRLISVSRKRAEQEIGIPRSGFGVVRRLVAVDNYTYWSNAKDVLIELMNLQMIKSAPVPSRREHVIFHRDRTYELTKHGEDMLAELEKNQITFREKLLELMYRNHSHLRSLVKTLEDRDIYVPIYRLEERCAGSSDVDNTMLVKDVTDWVAEKALQYELTLDVSSLEKRLQKKAAEGKATSRTKFISAINECVESEFLKAHGLSFDNVTFEHLYRLGEQMHLMNYGYLRTEESSSLVVFSTAEIKEEPAFQVERHKLCDYERRFLEAIPQEHNTLGEPFVPIHDLRTRVCHKLKCNNELFDYVVQNLFLGRYKVEYKIALLRDMPRVLPPSAKPLKINNEVYFTITIIQKKRGE